MSKRTSWTHVLTTEFAIQLIKQIPSNLYCSMVLKVPVSAVASKRATIEGAVKGGHYKMSDGTIAAFRPILLKIRKDLRASKIDSTVTSEETVKKENTVLIDTVAIKINGVIVAVKNGDELEIRDNKLYLIKAL